MRLLNDATSPFGRKVMVAGARTRPEAGNEQFCQPLPNPASSTRTIRCAGHPTLVTETGDAVYDSSVILGFLDTLHGGELLIPQDPTHRIPTRIARADGLIEATLQRAMELRRPEELRSAAVTARLEWPDQPRADGHRPHPRGTFSLDPLRAADIDHRCLRARLRRFPLRAILARRVTRPVGPAGRPQAKRPQHADDRKATRNMPVPAGS